jgi:hypothetical protein
VAATLVTNVSIFDGTGAFRRGADREWTLQEHGAQAEHRAT